MTERCRVLLVEDNAGDARLVREMLRDARGTAYDIVQVETLAAAEAALASRTFDAVLLDLGLPDGGGVDSFRRLRPAAEGLPVVVMTGLDDEQAAREALQAGAQDYLVKGKVDETTVSRSVLYALERCRMQQQLHAQQQFAEGLLETAQAIVLVLDPEGRIVRFNPYLASISGRTLDEVRGRDWFDTFLPAGKRDEVRRLFGRAIGGTRTTGNIDPLVTKDGRERLIEWFDTVLRGTDGRVTGLLAMGQDVTEREQGRREAQALQRAARAVLEDTEFAAAAKTIYEACADHVGARAGYLALLSEDGSNNEVLFLDAGGAPCTVDPSLPMPIRGLRADAYRTGKAVYDNDFPHSEHAGLMPSGHVLLENVMFVPLNIAGRTVGVIGLANKPGGFTPADARAAEAFGEVAAVALARHRTARDRQAQLAVIQRHARDLEELTAGAMRLSTAVALDARAAEAVRTCVERFGAVEAWIGVGQPGGGVRVLAAHPPGEVRAGDVIAATDGAKRATCLQTLTAAGPVVVEDCAAAPACLAQHGDADHLPGRSAVGFPLVARGRVTGTLVVHGDRPWFFDAERQAVFQAYAQLVATMLANAELYDEAQKGLGRVEALRSIDMAITGSLDPRVTFSVILDHAVAQLRVDAADLLLFEPTGNTLAWETGRGYRSAVLRGTRLRIGRGHAGLAALERRTVVVPRLADEPGEFHAREVLEREGFVFYAAAPLIGKGQVRGVLEVFHRSPLDPSDDWRQFLEALAGQAALAIENVTLFHDLQRSNLELNIAYDTTIEGWSRALDLRDKETEGHSVRVTEMTERLARKLGFADAELVHVRRGALLHDIGKVGIPDAILLKPGKLTDEEWVVMRQHPVLARQLLHPIPYLRPAIDVPYCHHEKWDGSGYPRGLQADEIPLAARAFAVVDVWDALRSDRPYRKAWTEEQTRDLIRSEIGRHFDPAVGKVFLELDWSDVYARWQKAGAG